MNEVINLHSCEKVTIKSLHKEILIPLGENKTTTIIFEPNLKVNLLNAGQNDRHWSDLQLRLPEYGTKFHQSEGYNGEAQKIIDFHLHAIRDKHTFHCTSLPMNLPSTCDQGFLCN